MQALSPVSWKTAYQLVPGGERLVSIQLTIPTGTGGMIVLNVPPIVAADAKAFAADISEAATGLVLP